MYSIFPNRNDEKQDNNLLNLCVGVIANININTIVHGVCICNHHQAVVKMCSFPLSIAYIK